MITSGRVAVSTLAGNGTFTARAGNLPSMLCSLLSIALAQATPSETEWKAGELTVVVRPRANEWTISRGASHGITFQGYDSIDRIETKPNQLTLRARGSGGTETIVIRPDTPNSVRVRAAWIDIPAIGTARFVETFRFGTSFDRIAGSPGFEDRWRTPVVTARDGKTACSIAPILDEPATLHSFPRLLEQNSIGRANARYVPSTGLTRDETPVAPDKPALGLGYGDSQFYVCLVPSQGSAAADRAMALDDVFMRTVQARKFRAYPQKAPYNVAAYTTFSFRNQVEVDPNDPAGNVTSLGNTWQTEKMNGVDVGRPGALNQIKLGDRGNAMRSAWTMKDWGTTHRQSRWVTYAEQLARLSLQHIDSEGDRVATAYYALRWIKKYPSDPVSTELIPFVQKVANDLSGPLHLPAAATFFASLKTPQTPATLRSSSGATFDAEKIIRAAPGDPWSLELACVLAEQDAAKAQPLAEWLVAYQSENQMAFDRSELDQLPLFGAFAGARGEYSPDSPLIAAAIGRLGVIYRRAVWIERGAWGLRAGNTLINPNYLAAEPDAFPLLTAGWSYPGFGNQKSNEPDPRTDFEDAEGLYLSAVWDLLSATGGLYYLSAHQGVGVDGFFLENGKLYNAFLGNPRSFIKEFLEPTRSAVSDQRIDSLDVPGWPMISHFEVERRADQYVLTASPGTAIANAPRFGEFILTSWPLSLSDAIIQAERGASGYEAVLSGSQLEQPAILFRASSPLWQSARTFMPTGWPLRGVKNFPMGWVRRGDLRWTDPLSKSTGDANNPAAVGSLISPAFTSEGRGIRFEATGQGDCRVSVQLEHTRQEMVHFILPSRGANRSPVTLELPLLDEDRYVVVVEDNDPRGFIKVEKLELLP